MGISTGSIGWSDNGNSKKNYAKAIVACLSDIELLRVAADLDLAIVQGQIIPVQPPANWTGPDQFRLFISHISKDKEIATRLKTALLAYGISGFVAHQDIHPTLSWMDEIERALQTMDAFLAVHTLGFSVSNWTQQEVGFALGKGVKIISFKFGEDPTGFIGKHQALPRINRTAEQIAEEIDVLLRKDERTKERLGEVQKLHRERDRVAMREARQSGVAPDPIKRSDVKVGTRVTHSKFGIGAVVGIEGNKLEIQFDKVGQKRVLNSFVEVSDQ